MHQVDRNNKVSNHKRLGTGDPIAVWMSEYNVRDSVLFFSGIPAGAAGIANIVKMKPFSTRAAHIEGSKSRNPQSPSKDL